MIKKESETVEFKKSTTQLKEAVISLCAMLNKHEQGTVYFGIKDDGSVCGQEIGKKTTADISHEIMNNLKPLPKISVEVLPSEDKTIIKVDATGLDTPYSAYGRYYTRIDDADTYMDASELQKYFENKDKTYSKWEEKPTEFGIEKVDEDLLIQYIRDANDTGRLNYIYRNPEEALHKLNLMNDDGVLNNAGYYLFGNDGPVLLKEVIYPTDDRTTFTDLKHFNGNIFECINEAMKYIQNNIHYSAEIEGTKRVEKPEIPLKALREIIVNSFAHCHYGKGDSNEIAIYRSKVRIYNPGGIPNNVSPVDFANGKIGSKIRNPLIAMVLFKNGMIDAFGTGFDRTFRACAENATEYEYSNDEFGFTFIFKRDDNFKRLKGKDDKINARINAVDRQITDALKDTPYITVSEIALKIGKSEATVNRHLKGLIERKTIERVGSRKSGYWKLLL